jgi:hypothetical protein
MMHLVILFRSYSSKKAYFSMDKSKNPDVMERASDFLDNAARLRQTEMCVIIDGFEAKKKSGAIPSSIPDGKIYAAAEQQATFAQANHIARANLNPRQMQEFERSFSDAQHPNGSTWTAGYGNLSLNSEQTSSTARKTAKKTTAKMEATVAAGLSNNRVKEILACQRVPLSQGTDYLEGKVTDERGNNFCSQDALLMLRNQLDDDSADDE